MPKGIPGPNVTMNSGRHSPNAPTSTKFKPVGSGDSGGKIFNPVQKAKSNLVNSQAPKLPDTTGAGNPLGAPGSGVVTKKVAGIAKFYGK